MTRAKGGNPRAAPDDLLTLEEVAVRMKIEGKDPARTVRNLFRKHCVPIVDLGKNKARVTEAQYSALVEKRTCLQSENAAISGTSAARYVSVPKGGASKNTLRDAVAERRRTHTGLSAKAKSGRTCLMVVK